MTLRDSLIAIFVVFLWSTSLLVQKFAVNHISIYVLGFLRLLTVIPWILIYKRPPHPLWRYLIIGFFWNVLNFLFIGIGFKIGIGAGLSSFLIQTNVFFGVVFCFFLLREKVNSFEIFGMMIAFYGVYLISQEDSISFSANMWMGIISIILSSACWGIGFTLLKKMKIGGTIADNAWLAIVSAPLLFSLPFIIEGPEKALSDFSNINITGLTCALYVGFTSTIWASILWLKLGQRVSTAQQVPFMLLLPIFTSVLSALFMQEILTPTQIFSGGIILLGVFITRTPLLLNRFKNYNFLFK